MKVYITKYALSAGIEFREVEPSPEFPGMVSWQTGYFRRSAHGEGREWHRTWEAARARANEMRAAKIKSLRKSIAKLEAMTFEQSKEPA